MARFYSYAEGCQAPHPFKEFAFLSLCGSEFR